MPLSVDSSKQLENTMALPLKSVTPLKCAETTVASIGPALHGDAAPVAPMHLFQEALQYQLDFFLRMTRQAYRRCSISTTKWY